MSDRPDVTDLVYAYDGSFPGFLCCVFESFYEKEQPMDISVDPPQSLLYRIKYVETDQEKADRVYRSLSRRICPAAEEAVRLCFLTCLQGKERAMLDFLRLGYRVGRRVMDMLQDERVNTVRRAVDHLTREAHLLKGFVRFSSHNGTLASVIGPKNFVLPLLADHFSSRLPEERFLIYDENHHAALVYQPYQARIIRVESFCLPPADQEEARCQALWRRFYQTIAVEGRENPRCRIALMPKRYWRYMTEFQLPGEPAAALEAGEEAKRLVKPGPPPV